MKVFYGRITLQRVFYFAGFAVYIASGTMTLPTFLHDDHRRFSHAADEWLICYAQLSATMIVMYPTTFSISMVLELYLKAYAAFLAGNGVDVTKFGHNLAGLYEDLQTKDPQFPTHLRLITNLSKFPLHDLDSENWQSNWYTSLTDHECLDIKTNYEIYLAMQYGLDLKYGVSPSRPKDQGRIISSSWRRLNPWLANFVRGVRKRIGPPSTPADDRLYWALRHSELHPKACRYLASIFDNTTPDATT